MLLAAAVSAALGMGAPLRLEAEDGKLVGPVVADSRQGFSGRGYVTGFIPDGASVTWTVRARPGIYMASVGFATPGSPKGMDLQVGKRRHGAMLPAVKEGFARHQIGRIEITEEVTEVSVLRGWGYYDLDYVELTPAQPLPPPKPVPARLIHPKPSREAQKLMDFLARNYGKTTLSGQYGASDVKVIEERTGHSPAIFADDFMDYSPSRVARGADPKNATENMIAMAKKGHIIGISWHWNAPFNLVDTKDEKNDLSWYKGFYTNATTFDVSVAMRDPESRERKELMKDIDAIAIELKKLQAAKVPVLWRPLHEAEGGWFWWGAKGPEPCKWLWKVLVERLHGVHKLDNLIWVWNSADPAWYPGDDLVDIMSIDSYPSDRRDPLSGDFEKLLASYDGKKMLGLAEFPGAPDVDRKVRFGVRWSFFVSWVGDLGPSSNDPAFLKEVYSSKRVSNLSEVKKGLR